MKWGTPIRLLIMLSRQEIVLLTNIKKYEI